MHEFILTYNAGLEKERLIKKGKLWDEAKDCHSEWNEESKKDAPVIEILHPSGSE